MGGSRQSRGYHRREEEARERRRQRILMLSAGGVLGVVAIILLVGVVVTMVLPPRATVAEVGDRSFTARDLADRSVLALRLDAQAGSMAQLIDLSMDAMVREEVLRQAGEPLVGEPSDEDIDEHVRELFDIDTAPPDPEMSDDGDPAEGMSDEEFEALYQQFLDERGIARDDFERIRRAEITSERLRDQFEEEIPGAGPQVHLYSVESIDRGLLEELHERVGAGEDFVEVALELELAEEAEELDAGWRAEDALSERLLMLLEGVEAGEVTPVQEVVGTLNFEVHYVEARENEREYDEAMREELARLRLDEFVEEQRVALGVRIDLSDSERNWVGRQVQSALGG